VVLPAGTGKTIKVAVADDDLVAKLDKGQIDFDVLVATPDFMPKLGKYAKLLGPRGLMPNPKSGTVTTDVKKAVEEAKAGRVEYRVDSTGIIHTAFGKVSFKPDDLKQRIGSTGRSKSRQARFCKRRLRKERIHGNYHGPFYQAKA